MFVAICAKGNYFCDFMFASLDDIVLPKWDYPLWKELAPWQMK